MSSGNTENTLSVDTIVWAEIYQLDLKGRSLIDSLNGNNSDPARFSVNNRKINNQRSSIFQRGYCAET
jgi:hypothetical protein